jgi:hypothetical protein
MATVAVLLTSIAGPGWFAKSLYDTNAVIERLDTALDDERVQLAIADKVTDELFLIAGIDRAGAIEAIDAAGVDDAAIDPEASLDAEPTPGLILQPTPTPEESTDELLANLPIAEALESVATERAVAIVASNRLDSQILLAVRQSHEQFLDVVDGTLPPNAEGVITINLKPVVEETLVVLADDPVLGFLSANDVSIGDSTFIVVTDGQGGSVWWTMLRSFPDWANLAIFGIVVLLGGAIVLSPERDRIMLTSGVGIAVIALVIAAAAWAARAIVSTVFIRNEVPRGAFEAIYDLLSQKLISLEIRIAIFAAILAAIGGILGFFLDWRAERALAAEAADSPYGYDPSVPTYRSPYGNTGIPPGPQR